MYPVSANFHSLAIQDAPTTRIRIYFIDDTVDCADDNDVQTNGTLLVNSVGDTDSNGRIADSGVVFNEYFNPEKNLKIGSCVSSQIEMTLLNFDGALNSFSWGRCKVYLDVYDAANSAWIACPMGVYILEQPVRTNKRTITVSGYDQMQKLDASAATWWNSIDWLTTPVSMYDLLTGLATAAGFSVSSGSASAMLNEATTYSFPPVDGANMTYREILSKIAEASGTIARFDRDGALDMRWFTNAESGTSQVTYTGQSISIADGTGKTVDSLTVQITPTQNFNGYTKPWPAGGGKNKLPPTTSVSGTQNGVTFTVNSDGSVSTSGTATGTAIFTYFINFTDLTENEQYILSGCPTGGGMSSKYKLDYRVSGGYMTDTGAGASFTFVPLSSANSIRIVVYSGTNASGLVFKPMIRLASVSDATFAPYSNICPITGRTGLSVYVSPTQDQQDATTYAEDWTSQAGTVYAGSIEVVSGTLKARQHYASYNGETLVGPWMSSMDEYAAGTSPTTGAEVVDLGGAETTYQLTPTQISLLTGQNYLWASNSGILTAIVGELGLVTIDTDQIGNQCLSVDFAEYGVETYGYLTYKYGTQSKKIRTWNSLVPDAKNTYIINGNEFINQNNPAIVASSLTHILWHLFVIGVGRTNPIAYYPAQAKLIMDWSIEAGDQIVIKRNSTPYIIPIFQQTLKWRGGYVVSDLLSDGDPINPNTAALAAGNEQEQQKTITLPGNYTATPVQMKPGQHFYMVVSGKPSGTNSAKELIIAQCDDDGTVSYGLAIGGNGLTCYVDQVNAPYILTVINNTTNDATATIFYF